MSRSASRRWRRRTATAVLASSVMVLGLPALGAQAAGGPGAAAHATTKAGSTFGKHSAASATDGDASTYWQAGKKSAQWVQTDLGKAKRVKQVVLKLPAGWESRKQTLALQGSADGTSWATLKTSAQYTFGPANGNTVKVSVPATLARYVRAEFTANSVTGTGQLAEMQVVTTAAASPNLAQGKTFSESGHSDVYGAANAGDGNRNTYWESRNNSFPQWVQVDLGSSVKVNQVTLRLPSGWPSRQQTLKIQGSTDNQNFTDLSASKAYTFDANNDQSTDISFDTTTTRYVRVLVTANTGWPAGQLSELEVYGPATGDTQAPSAPSGLAYTEPASGQIKLDWKAASDDTGVTGYDIYANGQLRASVAGNVLTYTDNQPASTDVTYYVRAKDAAGNVSSNSNSVTRKGQGGDTQAPTAPGNLAYTQSGSDVKLTWQAASDNVKVTGYDVYANDKLVKSVAGDVLTYTDTPSAAATVTYYVKAKDAAGNVSGASNSVTRAGSPSGPGSNLAQGKPIDASSSTFTFVAANANDGLTSTYWESAGGSYPATLTTKLGANADLNQVVVKLNPDTAWSSRTQNIQVLGRDQDSTSFTSLAAAKDYTFDPGSGNTVTIPVTGSAADVQLKFTKNTGAPGAQVAEFQVIGTPAANPDLKVTGITNAPAAPVESDAISLSATVTNSGTKAAKATDLNFSLGGTKAGTADVPALAAGESKTVTASIGARDAGSYPLSAEVDPSNKVIEQNESNNTFTRSDALVVKPVSSSDLLASPVSWSPSSATAGQNVNFSVAIKNQGTQSSASGAHNVTLTIQDASGTTVKTLTGAYNGSIAAGSTTSAVNLGSWTAANGKFTVKTVIAADDNELPVKRDNNTTEQALFIGRGANMPYDMYEAEDGTVGGGAKVVGPNRTIGDVAGEASGRKAVTLSGTGQYVEWTTRAATNTLVTRFSVPDGTNTSLNVYVDGQFLKAVDLTSKYAWLYGNETAPGNSPGSGAPRHIYDEANLQLGKTVPAGSKIRLQKDAANSSTYAIDFVNTELATAAANPDPAAYTVPAGFSHQDVQNALDKVRMDTTGKLVGVYLPAGDYETSSKFQVYGKAVKVVGAGPWFTRFHAPSSQENTDIGFRAEASAKGSSFAGFAYFGNYTSRIDGPGKVFDFSNVSDITIDNIWVEHMVCLYWGANTDNMTIKNSRIRDMFADGVNMTNGSTDNHVVNNDARATGDDSFALFSAIDAGGADEKNNVFENLTSTLTWRAAGLAVYGGYSNTFRNIRIADTLVYSGITISSLDFGYPMNGFGTEPTTVENVTLERTGGHFWGSQVFPAIWMFSASKVFQGIRVNNVDINDSTYGGVMFQTNYVGGQPQFPVKDTILTDISITNSKKSGDAFDAKSGWGIWANELPEPGQGPAVGEATFKNLKLSGNAQDIRNTTSTFKINIVP
ncbi:MULTISPECIES: discoidin domain-containing protein [Streptomyces]|uniref:Discoidin domain-containing protein n=1 Tax=Streptomyces evansiae TaxID=3075535 RepID=A0ABU2R491_9ACTN|nr:MULTISPECIES: discoidin domain-containing protein [unclassified Streptomyces]MDT0411153.1 discoidin domain-containing protein [Streptomyces sp. DSM 41979]MYQ59336.1 Secreted glycosyl hydrolase [Streptomyces sp. SID4926]SCE12381.1 CARDB protein [Streptomyces sp. DfronAA-171]